MLRVLPVVSLLACGSAATQSQVKPIDIKPMPAAAPVKPCVRQPEEAAPVTHARVDGSVVSYCIGSAVDQCFALDVDAASLKRIEQPPEAQDRSLVPAGHVETTNPDLKVCNTTGCKTLTPQIWPGTAPLHAATNGSIAAVMLGDADKGKGYVDVFDVMKSKKLASFKFARGDFKCGDVALLGNTIYVMTNMCANPSGRGSLYTVRGRKIANVGGKGTFGTYGGAFTQVEGSQWAFLEENGNMVVLQDVVKGKVAKTIDVTTLFDPVKMSNPGESAIVRYGTGQLAVIGGSPANGSVAIVNIATGDVKVVHAPLCGAGG
jgi:hypothetical protein